jgi:excisionase family DNA binding protein
MLTVPEAARRTGRNEETIRRWIRSGRLRSTKAGTQHLIEEYDLEALVESGRLEAPDSWQRTIAGEPMPDVVAAVRRSRGEH